MFSKDAQCAAYFLAGLGIVWIIIMGVIAMVQDAGGYGSVNRHHKKIFWWGVAVFYGPLIMQLYMYLIFG